MIQEHADMDAYFKYLQNERIRRLYPTLSPLKTDNVAWLVGPVEDQLSTSGSAMSVSFCYKPSINRLYSWSGRQTALRDTVKISLIDINGNRKQKVLRVWNRGEVVENLADRLTKRAYGTKIIPYNMKGPVHYKTHGPSIPVDIQLLRDDLLFTPHDLHLRPQQQDRQLAAILQQQLQNQQQSTSSSKFSFKRKAQQINNGRDDKQLNDDENLILCFKSVVVMPQSYTSSRVQMVVSINDQEFGYSPDFVLIPKFFYGASFFSQLSQNEDEDKGEFVDVKQKADGSAMINLVTPHLSNGVLRLESRQQYQLIVEMIFPNNKFSADYNPQIEQAEEFDYQFITMQMYLLDDYQSHMNAPLDQYQIVNYDLNSDEGLGGVYAYDTPQEQTAGNSQTTQQQLGAQVIKVVRNDKATLVVATVQLEVSPLWADQHSLKIKMSLANYQTVQLLSRDVSFRMKVKPHPVDEDMPFLLMGVEERDGIVEVTAPQQVALLAIQGHHIAHKFHTIGRFMAIVYTFQFCEQADYSLNGPWRLPDADVQFILKNSEGDMQTNFYGIAPHHEQCSQSCYCTYVINDYPSMDSDFVPNLYSQTVEFVLE
ncbi:hypothetical protein MIR68_003986 [Amoeboaphelidium protococcarum]|nr:hypothetical protein MIR68_003986 [Amoeboaphelidium protococcarum]